MGDQILKVAGVNVQSSIEASRAIKMVSSMQVKFPFLCEKQLLHIENEKYMY